MLEERRLREQRVRMLSELLRQMTVRMSLRVMNPLVNLEMPIIILELVRFKERCLLDKEM